MKIFVLFQAFDVIMQLRASWFKTLEHSISYNTSHWTGEKNEGKCAFRNLIHLFFLQQR